MWARVINIIAGLAIMVMPGILDFPRSVANNNYIVGPLVITFSLVAIWEATRNVRLFNILAAVWMIASPFVLQYGAPESYINIGSGVLIGAFSLVKGKITQRFGGGWRSLGQSNPMHLREAAQQEGR